MGAAYVTFSKDTCYVVRCGVCETENSMLKDLGGVFFLARTEHSIRAVREAREHNRRHEKEQAND